MAIIACGALGFFALRDRTPLLTRAILKEAHDRWEKAVPRDYDVELTVEVDGVAPQHYRTQVRGGRVTRFEQNGRQDEGGSEYNVAGLFEWIDRDLEMSTGPAVAGAPAHATLKATFDPQFGYPLVYKRIAALGRSVFITVDRFQTP
jgi:hypothetical protein